MQKSIGDDMATVVNGRIVMKGAGRLAGLCLETFTSQSGQVFWENNWYAPLYPKLRTKIRAAIIQGDTSLETEQGQWMQLRTVGNNFWLPSADLLSTLRQFVAESGKTRTLSAEEIKARREYIRREKELFRLPTGTVFSEEVTDPFAEE